MNAFTSPRAARATTTAIVSAVPVLVGTLAFAHYPCRHSVAEQMAVLREAKAFGAGPLVIADAEGQLARAQREAMNSLSGAARALLTAAIVAEREGTWFGDARHGLSGDEHQFALAQLGEIGLLYQSEGQYVLSPAGKSMPV